MSGLVHHTDASLLARGYAQAKAVTFAHAKSFAFASGLLFGRRRQAAFALYAFCRRLDDLVDEGGGGGEVSLPDRLDRARRHVGALYLSLPELADARLTAPASRVQAGEAEMAWAEGELAALEDTVRTFRIPEAPFQDLIAGMEMDLTKDRYENFEALHLYCHRVAGVVGQMMTPVLGYSDERAMPLAAALGIGMQLTNILRDVREDLERGRIYLPADELAAFNLTEQELRAGRVDARWRAFMRFQISRARAYYARGAEGVPLLTGVGTQRMVRLMGGIYGDILRDIEARDFDVFSARAHVSKGRKLQLALQVFLAPKSVLRRVPELARAPLPSLVDFTGDAPRVAGTPVSSEARLAVGGVS